MAYLLQTKSEEEIKGLTVAKARTEYQKLASVYNKILDGKLLYCHKCGEHLSSDTYYTDKNYKSGYFPICKKCIMAMIEQRDKKNDEPNETKESVKRVLHLMDLPYINSFYESCVKDATDGMKEKNRRSPFATYITAIKSLPQYRNLNWSSSEFEEFSDETPNSNRKPRKEIIKLFGSGFNNEDYLYLQDQYDEWRSRSQVDSKSQETYVVRICFKLLDIWKAQKAGKETDKLDKSLNELMSAANLQPRQNVGNASTDNLTWGQLIEKLEQTEPITEPKDEFKDADGIIKYIDIFFKGHLAKMMGLKNGYSHNYDNYMKKYIVTKPEYNEDEGSEAIFDALFGKEVE